MNAADQRRLTPWLAALCLLLAAAWLALLSGFGRNIEWLPPGAGRSLPSARPPGHAGSPPPLENDAEVWLRPLFTTDRRPAPVAAGQGQPASLENLELTGVILAPGMHMALLTDRADGRTVRVREGDALGHGGWVLRTLKPRSAEFVDNGQVTRLQLKVPAGGAPAAAGSADAAAGQRSGPATPVPRRKPADRPDEHRSGAAGPERVQALKIRIEQRRRQQATHAGDH